MELAWSKRENLWWWWWTREERGGACGQECGVAQQISIEAFGAQPGTEAPPCGSCRNCRSCVLGIAARAGCVAGWLFEIKSSSERRSIVHASKMTCSSAVVKGEICDVCMDTISSGSGVAVVSTVAKK